MLTTQPSWTNAIKSRHQPFRTTVTTSKKNSMALYAEPGGHVAKRPRVDFSASPQIHITTTSATTNQSLAASAALSAINHGILSPQYIEQQLTRKSHEPEKPNHILLFTVLNPTYPITCDVLNTICAPDRKSTLWTPVTSRTRMPSSAWKKKKNNKIKKKKILYSY